MVEQDPLDVYANRLHSEEIACGLYVWQWTSNLSPP